MPIDSRRIALHAALHGKMHEVWRSYSYAKWPILDS